MRFLVTGLLMLVLASGSIFAAPSVTLAWTAPTTYEDGVPIEAGKVIKYEIWRSTAADLSGAVRVAFDLATTTYTDTTIATRNTYYYYARAYFIDTLPSTNSNTASVRVWPPFKTQINGITLNK